MENFEQFKIANLEVILGGELVSTYYVGDDGTVYNDFYDTEREIIITLPPIRVK